MSKFLDLDAVLPPSRGVKVGGKEYQMKAVSVDDFIKLTRKSAELQKKAKTHPDDVGLAEIVQMQRDSVRLALPDMPEEVLGGMSYQQLEAIIEFARKTAELNAPEGEVSGKATAAA